MHFSLIELSYSEMDTFTSIINSNYGMIQPHLINKYQHQAYNISEDWVKKNYDRHIFYQFYDGEQKRPVGCVSIKKIVNFAYFEFFSIYHDYLHRGYGQIMMEFAQNEVTKLELAKIRLFVHNKATWARSAYQKYGFSLLLSEKQKIRNFENGRLAPHFLVNHLLYEKIL